MLLHVVTPVESGFPKRETFRFDWSGQSVRSLVAPWAAGPESWAAILDGKVIDAEEWDKPLNRGVDVVIVPSLAGEQIAAAVINLVVQIAVDLAINALFPQPRLSEPGDDQKTSTFGFEMRTGTLPGGSIPLAYGLHDLPGIRIHTEIAPHIDSDLITSTFGGNTGNEALGMIIALCSGPIESIGGQSDTLRMGSLTEPGSDVIPLPESIRINGILLERDTDPFSTRIPGATVAVRMGEIDQPVLTLAADTKTTVSVGLPLDELDQEATGVVSSTIISSVWVNVRFPNGLFFLDPGNGSPQTSTLNDFEFEISKRNVTDPENVGPWTIDSTRAVRSNTGLLGPGETIDHDPANPRGAFTVQWPVTPIADAVSMEVKVIRRTARFGTPSDNTIVSGAVLKNIVFTTSQGLIYPEIALLELSVIANEKLQRGDINVRARAKLKLVRVWDSVEGFSPETWEIPAAPFDWMSFPPGQNPAWILANYLITDQGTGQFVLNDKPLTSANIDWQSFRDLSERCETASFYTDELFFSCDLVMDTPRAAMDWIQTMLTLCQANLVLIGNKLSVTYQYRDAHGTVPARATFSGGVWTINFTQVFSAANVSDFQVTYANPSFRPTVIEARILNKDLDYERDQITIEDPNALGFNEPPGSVLGSLGVVKQAVDYLGVTRVKQVRWLALYSHNVNRLSRKGYTFRAGVDSIIAQPGDVIGLQSTAMRIGGNASFGASVSSGHTGNQTFIQITEAITIPADEDWSMFVSDGDDGVSEGLIPQDASERTFAAGANINIFTPGSPATPLSINYEELRPVAIGPLDSTVDAAQIVSVTLNADLTSTVEAVEWHPEFFDIALTDVVPPLPESAGPEDPDFNSDLVEEAAISTVSAPTASPPPVPGITLVSTGSGGHRITWDFPPDASSQIARVYTRPAAGGQWQLLGEVNGTSIETTGLIAGTTIQISVSTQDAQGNFSGPGTGLSVTLTVDEFPSSFVIPQVRGFTGTVTGEGILFTWEPFDATWVDVYEIRRGSGGRWNHAAKVGIAKGDRMFHVAGAGSYDYMIRARSNTGLYSGIISSSGAIAFDDVVGTTPLATYPLDDLVTAASGTLSAELQYDATNDWVEFQTGEMRGIYTTLAIDGTTVADRWWSVNWEQHSVRTTPFEELTHIIDGGDGMWWTIEGREATAAQPGADFTALAVFEDSPLFEAEVDIGRHRGSVGRYVSLVVEARFHNGTSWGSYENFHAGFRNAEQCQFRFTMNRVRHDEELRISKITVLGATRT